MVTLLTKLFIKKEGKEEQQVRKAYGTLCSILGIFLNVCLFAGKYVAGFVSGSIAIMADAFNNLSDAGSSFITLIGFVFAGKKPDSDHPFGHGRIEYLSGLGVAFLIMLMGVELGKSSVKKIRHPEVVELSALSIAILLVSILVKLYMAYYNRSIGKKIASEAMKATATDSLSDAVSTTVVLLAMLFLHFTNINIDGYCGLLVAILILLAGFNAAKDTISPLLGQAPEPEFVEQIEQIVTAHEEVVGIHDLIVHDYGPGRVMISLHAEVPGDGDIFVLHDVIDLIERELEQKLHCDATIHMDPIDMNNEAVSQKKAEVVALINAMEEDLTIHDFRMVVGNTHTNLIFDVVVPAGYKKSEEKLVEQIEQLVQEKWPECFTVIKVDHAYGTHK
ncbi:MAG: cation transporter [Lachnospiraceae bacterium]|nr:cation transporter [Lachnospiraceae bacterium]